MEKIRLIDDASVQSMGDLIKFVQKIDAPIMLSMSELGGVSESQYVKWILSSSATTNLVFRYVKN